MSSTIRTFLLVCSLLTLASACAFTPQKAFLSPQVDVIEQNIGKGKKINVTITDERLSDKVGGRGIGWNSGGQITLENVEAPLTTEIKSSFEKKGFNVVDNQKTEPKINVSIELIEYST